MPIIARTLLLITLPCLALSALAATVQRCEDANGNITFTSLGCAHSDSMQMYEAYNAPPGSGVPLMPEADYPAPRITGTAKKEVVVVGQHDDGCGNRVSSEQRRRAIINQRTLTGMTVKDVESALGKPDKIVNRNGEIRYSYDEKKGRSSQVVFDENGCVKGKR
jgi:hypothetical protein